MKKKILDPQENKEIPDWATYRKIKGTRTAGIGYVFTEPELREWSKCYYDPIYFIEKYCILKDNPITLRQYQKDIILSHISNKYILNYTSRQTGMTLIQTLVTLYRITFTKSYSLVISHNQNSSLIKQELLVSLYLHLPFFIKKGILSMDKKFIHFEDHSTITYAHSTSIDTIKGSEFTDVYMDNFNYFENPNKIMGTIIYSASKFNASISITSGPGSEEFTKRVINSLRKEGDPKKNQYHLNRISWWEVEGRDKEWKNKEISNLGEEEFSNEYELDI
jgi:hypothetical protein